MKRFIIVFIAFMVMVASVNEAVAIAQSVNLQKGAQKKIAFVAGNSKYKNMPQLPAALNELGKRMTKETTCI